eukprot:scaffold3456_cov78-Skeletonema_dohrnii-CCMP3373.AAC.9
MSQPPVTAVIGHLQKVHENKSTNNEAESMKQKRGGERRTMGRQHRHQYSPTAPFVAAKVIDTQKEENHHRHASSYWVGEANTASQQPRATA